MTKKFGFNSMLKSKELQVKGIAYDMLSAVGKLI